MSFTAAIVGKTRDLESNFQFSQSQHLALDIPVKYSPTSPQDWKVMEDKPTNVVSMATTHRILVVPMAQRSEIRQANEDWTGKSSTVERRKLQNRLNKRASSTQAVDKQNPTNLFQEGDER